MILVINNSNYRLCQDNKWRDFANFGNYPECVKIYKRISSAFKKAEKIKGLVVMIDDPSATVDASGIVMINGKNYNLNEFIVKETKNETSSNL